MLRLLLIRHGATAATRMAGFGDDEGLKSQSMAQAQALAKLMPRHRGAICGPEPACRETADALGLVGAITEPALAGCDFAAWRGLTLEQLQERDPSGLNAWLSDPDAAPHGGESLRRFIARVGGEMEAVAVAGGDGNMVMVVDAGVIKAALCHALAAPARAFWRLDVTPLNLTELHVRERRWTVACVNSELGRKLR